MFSIETDHLSPQDKQWFVDFYYQMASLGTSQQTKVDKPHVSLWQKCSVARINQRQNPFTDAGCRGRYRQRTQVRDLR